MTTTCHRTSFSLLNLFYFSCRVFITVHNLILQAYNFLYRLHFNLWIDVSFAITSNLLMFRTIVKLCLLRGRVFAYIMYMFKEVKSLLNVHGLIDYRKSVIIPVFYLFFCRIISIFGIVLMAFADNTGGKSLFASTSSTLSAENRKKQCLGKILLLLMYVPLLIENVDSSSWIRLSFGLCLIVSNAIGYRINISAILMIVWLLLGNLPFAGRNMIHHFNMRWYEHPSYLFFINTIVITGGLLLMLACSENTDLKKKTQIKFK